MDFRIYNLNDVIVHGNNDNNDHNIQKGYKSFIVHIRPYGEIENRVSKNKVTIIYFNLKNLPVARYTMYEVFHHRIFTSKYSIITHGTNDVKSVYYRVEIRIAGNIIVTIFYIQNHSPGIKVNNNVHQNNDYVAEMEISTR